MLLAVADVGHLRHLRVLREVDRDVLREDARLELSHLRVLAAAAEEAGRLDAEVAKLLPATVDHGEGERLLEAIPLRLGRLLLVAGHGLLDIALLGEVVGHPGEVTLVEVLDMLRLLVPLEQPPPTLHEVLLEDLLRGVVGVLHGGEHRGHLLAVDRQHDVLVVVGERHLVRLVEGREDDAVVVEGLPLLAAPLPPTGVPALLEPVLAARCRIALQHGRRAAAS
mmetsp:Transcript_80880/g.196208  ORF Transcript_80880/g.196208 Transcript_80880/m.196208 type:complete len:224 (-) Transcript_80880:193-864(-)